LRFRRCPGIHVLPLLIVVLVC